MILLQIWLEGKYEISESEPLNIKSRTTDHEPAGAGVGPENELTTQRVSRCKKLPIRQSTVRQPFHNKGGWLLCKARKLN